MANITIEIPDDKITETAIIIDRMNPRLLMRPVENAGPKISAEELPIEGQLALIAAMLRNSINDLVATEKAREVADDVRDSYIPVPENNVSDFVDQILDDRRKKQVKGSTPSS